MKRLTFLLPLWIFLSVSVVVAQQPTTCPAIVEAVLGELAENCGELSRNTACYGNVLVESTFQTDVPPDTFSTPADRAELRELDNLETHPLNMDTGEWGIAVLNAQANVPGTYPGQGVTFLLIGDASIDNRIDTNDALDLGEPVEVTASTDAVLRDTPSRDGAVVDIVAVETAILADATDRQREWVRVRYNGQAAWVMNSEIAEIRVVDNLPIVTTGSQSPMQAFYFSTGIGQPDCVDAPNVITVQGREDFVVELSVNGAQVRIGSTIDFRTLSEDRVAMTVREGTLEVIDTGVVAVAGETIIAATDSEGTIIDWEPPRPATDDEIRVGTAAQLILASVVPSVSVDATTVAGELIHIVVRGDTLYSIGRQYQASLPAIVERNSLDARGTIFVGQRLVIPNPGSGFIGLPGVGIPSVDITIPDTGTVTSTCGGFTATSPLDGLAFGSNAFYWDAPTDATSISRYRVIVVNTRTGQVVSFDAPAGSTSISGSVDQETVGFGFDFYWLVQALSADGSVLCNSQQIYVQRSSQDGPITAPTFTATWGCAGLPSTDLIINVSGAPAGEPLDVTFNDSILGPQSLNLTGPSDSAVYSLGTRTASNGVVTATISGVSVALLPNTIIGCP